MTMNVTEIIRKTMGWCPNARIKNIAVDNSMEYANISGTRGNRIFTGESTVYEENAPYSEAAKLIMVLGFSALAYLYFISVFGHFFGFKKVSDKDQYALLLTVSIFAFAMWSIFSMKFRITNTSVEVVLPPFNYRILISDIKEVKTIEYSWFKGYGLRLWERKLAFISMRKSAVLIEKKKGFFRKLILTTQNPEEFIKKLKEEMK